MKIFIDLIHVILTLNKQQQLPKNYLLVSGDGGGDGSCYMSAVLYIYDVLYIYCLYLIPKILTITSSI